MSNKFLVIIVIILAVSCFISCLTSKHSKATAAMPGTWQSTPIEIDGDSRDWPSPYPNYDSKALVAYATSNDDKNLYITMETGDELTQIKILKMGMIVSIDTGGKKSPQFNISFPLQNDNSDFFEMPKPERGQKTAGLNDLNSKQRLQRIKKGSSEATQYALDGFRNCSGGYMVSQTAPCGVKVKLGIDEYNELIWEAAIPFKVLYNKTAVTNADAGKPVSVCFAIKGFKKPESKSDNTASQGMNPGMGGAGGGMRGGSRGGGGMAHSQQADPKQPLYESTKTWKHFGLAAKP